MGRDIKQHIEKQAEVKRQSSLVNYTPNCIKEGTMSKGMLVNYISKSKIRTHHLVLIGTVLQSALPTT